MYVGYGAATVAPYGKGIPCIAAGYGMLDGAAGAALGAVPEKSAKEQIINSTL